MKYWSPNMVLQNITKSGGKNNVTKYGGNK